MTISIVAVGSDCAGHGHRVTRWERAPHQTLYLGVAGSVGERAEIERDTACLRGYSSAGEGQTSGEQDGC